MTSPNELNLLSHLAPFTPVWFQRVGVPDFSLAKPFPPLHLLLFLPSRLFPLLHKASPLSVTFLPTAQWVVMSWAKRVCFSRSLHPQRPLLCRPLYKHTHTPKTPTLWLPAAPFLCKGEPPLPLSPALPPNLPNSEETRVKGAGGETMIKT